MPLTLAAFASGELSTSRVNLLVNTNQPCVSDIFARDEEILLDIVKTTRFADACRAVKYWQLRADPDGSEDKAKRKFEARSAHISKTLDDVIKLDALFDPVNGEIFLNELQRLEDELFQHDWSQAKAIHGENTTIDKLKRTPAQRRCDALVEMAKRSATSLGGSNKPLINIVIGSEKFKDLCETASGTVLTTGQVIPLLKDTQIESIMFDGKSKLIDIKHKRSFVGSVRRALDIRDRHCQHESECDVPATKCQGDHKLAWSKGGVTDITNGQLLCGFHNRAKGTGPP